MSATTAILAGRRAAENLMLDTCTVKRVTGTSTDDNTAAVTPTYSTVYSGLCKLQRPAAAGRRDIAEDSVAVAPLELHLPISGSAGIQTDDVVTVTASQLDADNVGKVFRIAGPARGTFRTARRLPVTEVTS